MTSMMGVDNESDFAQGLRAYSDAVASALGIGLEACAFDLDAPASVYVAIDWRLDRFPGRDLALLWDERHGWAAAVEASCGEDLVVIAYSGGPEIVQDPQQVVRFLTALRADDRTLLQLDPPGFRRPGNHEELVEPLAHYRFSEWAAL